MDEVFPFVDGAMQPRGIGFREDEARQKAFDAAYPQWACGWSRDETVTPPRKQPTPPAPYLRLYPRAMRLSIFGETDDVLEAWVRELIVQGATDPGLPEVWEVEATVRWDGGEPLRARLMADVKRHWVSIGDYVYWGKNRGRALKAQIERTTPGRRGRPSR
jgi:hypothetical protein